MKYELLDSGVAKISLDNGKANPLSKELSEGLMDSLERANKEAKAVLICGNPGMFSAGFDLKVLAQGMDVAKGMLNQGMIFMEKLYSHPQPVVIACEGHAVGMGVFMLLAADYRVGASGEFAIRLPETAIGMPFTPLLKIIAKAHIDPRHHGQAIVQSRAYDPVLAAQIGMLDEVVEPAQVVDVAMAKAEELAKLPADQFAENKLDIRADELSDIRVSMGIVT
ncbi:crotonase/enoyl-CoA hydratase family protein [Arenicella xantha]|uniref:Enoyl-CoA hydratase n=1 Tax=Arenicella xantha TaxID=644221 RepID=A0A395JEK5_9GAMM|nr:crotonase/enoyl-CoA hydratase family protein [Arenicella xantha]RBP47074.1 enoyl-CoA hydratase [Arenicella xantha]